MRPVLLHYHILKNGGSTIEEILRHSLFENFASFDHPHRDAEIKNPELIDYLKRHPELKAFSSHQIFYPVPKEPGFLFFDLCVLRDPFDRFRSVFDYFCSKPVENDPIRALAHGNSLRDFLSRLIEEMPWTVTDVQVNLLANGLVNDTPRPEDLETATRRMLETSFLGVLDLFEKSLVAGEYAMRTIFPALDCARERVNESARRGSTMEQRLEQFRKDCGEDVFAELSKRNQMDTELLRRARAEVQRRFEVTPDAEQRLLEIKSGIPRRSVSPRPHPEVNGFTRWKRGVRLLLDSRTSLVDALRYGGRVGDYAGQKLFDPEYYLRRYPDVAGARMNPLLHYVLHGARERRKPNRWFEPEFYLAGCPEARESADPLLHFAETAAANPHPLFDCESYRRANPDCDGNPLAHFLARGDKPQKGRIELNEVQVDVVRAGHLKRFFECVRLDQLA